MSCGLIEIMRFDADYAGDSDLGHVSELQLAPIVNIALPHLWFVNFFPSSDIRHNFLKKRPSDSGRWFIPFNFMVGKRWNKSTVASIEFGIPMVKDYQVYDFKVEARIGLFF